MHEVLALASCAACLVAEPSPSLYRRSLLACVEARQEQGHKEDPVVVVRNVIVDDPRFLYPIPTSLGSTQIEYMDIKALHQRFRSLRVPFQAIRIEPMINHGRLLTISCTEFTIHVRKREVVLWWRGGTKVRWRFDPALGDYVLVSAESFSPQM